MTHRASTLFVLFTAVAVAAPARAQLKMLAPPPGPGWEFGVTRGEWRVNGSDAPTIERRAWSVQAGKNGLMLEGLKAKEDGVNPGFLGLVGFSSVESALTFLEIEGGVGVGVLLYQADRRAEIAGECGRTPGCLFEAEGISSGWAVIGAVRSAAHLVLGKVSVGPWIVRTIKPFGSGGPVGKRGPAGQGWEIRVQTR